MRTFSRLSIAAALPLFLAVSCKSTSGGVSALSHEWGQTQVLGATLSCQEEKSEEAEYQSYIREHLKIIEAGNPKVFQGPLAAEKFCIVPVVYNDIDAGASPDGSLFINTGALRATETDAQFAAVLTHELAHITRRHGEAEIADFVRMHPQYLSAYADLTKQREQIQRFDILYTAPEQDWNKYLEKMRSATRKKWNASRSSKNTAAHNGHECESIATWEPATPERIAIQKTLPSPDYETKLCHQFFQEFNLEYREGTLFSNWKEVEADEVGYEFFLRAGYPEDEYAQFYTNTLNLDGPKEPNCEQGEKDHPGDCWRAKNIREELKKHRYDKDKVGPVKAHNFGNRLQSLRAKYAEPVKSEATP